MIELAGASPLVMRAYKMAREAHGKDLNRFNGEVYFLHPKRVAGHVQRWGGPDEAIAVALLHDTVEDTDLSLDEVYSEFPFEIGDAVRAVSREKGESHDAYYERVKADPLARLVKAADLADHLDPARTAVLEAEQREKFALKYQGSGGAIGKAALCAYPDDRASEHAHEDCIDAMVTEAQDYLLALVAG